MDKVLKQLPDFKIS